MQLDEAIKLREQLDHVRTSIKLTAHAVLAAKSRLSVENVTGHVEPLNHCFSHLNDALGSWDLGAQAAGMELADAFAEAMPTHPAETGS